MHSHNHLGSYVELPTPNQQYARLLSFVIATSFQLHSEINTKVNNNFNKFPL